MQQVTCTGLRMSSQLWSPFGTTRPALCRNPFDASCHIRGSCFKLAPTLRSQISNARHISSYQYRTLLDTLNDSQTIRLFEYIESKDRLPRKPSPPQSLRRQPVQPYVYRTESSKWAPLDDSPYQDRMSRYETLKIVSWNIYFPGPGQGERASAALRHLEERFGAAPTNLVLMLQEVEERSLQSLLRSTWVQRNFVVTDVAPPSDVYFDMVGQSFVSRIREWEAAPYFTLMMVPRRFGQVNSFRIPFRETFMGRDALFVDIPLSSPNGRTASRASLRLCTTHLESLWRKPERAHQLATISRLLKDRVEEGVIAGIVGGDMNPSDAAEHQMPKDINTDLKDAWEDVPPPPAPKLKPFQKDLTYGRARGNTFGYQSTKRNTRKRMDKFLYTGSLNTVPLTEPQDVIGKIGRLGIGLKTEVEAWEFEKTKTVVVRGELVKKTVKEYISDQQVESRREMCRKFGMDWQEPVRTKIDAWVSDHFAIATGIRVD